MSGVSVTLARSPAKAGAQRNSSAGSATFVWTPAFAGALNTSPRAGGETRALLPSARALAGAGAAAGEAGVPHRRRAPAARAAPAIFGGRRA